MKEYTAVFTIFLKDTVCYLRSAATAIAVPFFAMLVMVISAFAMNAGENAGGAKAAPGILWIACTFAGVIGLSQAFFDEKQNDCLRGLLLCPVERHIIYLGKLTGSYLLILAAELVITPLFFVFFGVSCRIFDLAVIMAVATLGIAAAGTLFSFIAGASELREVLFPVLFFPAVVPVVIAGVEATGILFASGTLTDTFDWLRVMAAYDLLFISLSAILFDTTLRES
jgi:heme exporter protein B